MTEKRFIVIDDGLDFMVRDTITGDDLIDADGVADVLNELVEENKELESLCKVLITHIEKNSIAFVIDENTRRLLE